MQQQKDDWNKRVKVIITYYVDLIIINEEKVVTDDVGMLC